MLRILGSARQLCGGMTRRDLLRVGSLGLAGIGMADLLRWREAAAGEHARPKSFGRAKSIILLHLYGSPSQLETLDPKPDAPLEIRGDLDSIASALPGVRVGELLPNVAKSLDRCTVLRSMTHPYPLHGVAFALTGVPAIDGPMELNPRDPRLWPYFGCVVDYLDSRARDSRGRRIGDGDKSAPKMPSPMTVPNNMALPFKFSSRRVGEVPRSGPYAAFLGAEFDPIWGEYVGTATKKLARTLGEKTFDDNDPFIGLAPDSHFVVPAATSLQPDVTLDRLNRRRTLVAQLDEARADLSTTTRVGQLDRYRRMTYELLESDGLRTALDVRTETPAVREMYGPTLFGQSCLAARRLVEAGSHIVSVFWDEFGLAGSGWDTHWNHYPRMKEELCPGFDRAWLGLITDLDQRGMLDDTLVVCTSEHGRTPKIKPEKGGGRDHWSRAYSSIVAGGGTRRGCVIGATDKSAGEVTDRPISPKDLLATMYHLLGIDHHQMIHDALGRPLPLVEGKVIEEALA